MSASVNIDTPQADEVEQKASPYAWYVLGILVVVYMFNFIDRQILAILANDIKADLGISDAHLGFLYGTAFGVFYALFGIPLGKLADSWNRTRLLAIGLTVWSGMTALSGFAKDGTQLTLARFGVGIGEASASPSAYSLISDWFPKKQRATALSIYASGLYIGGGLSLLIGSYIVGAWNAAYPGGGPLGLVGWQAAFMAVGLPGLLLAIWVASLREPPRGVFEGLETAPSARPFKAFFDELVAVIPPLTLIGAARRGSKALTINIAVALTIAAIAYALIIVTGSSYTSKLQFGAIGIGAYAVFSWASSLRQSDKPTFTLMWGTPAFLTTAIGYGFIAFGAYAVSFWSAPYAESVLGATKHEAALWVGAPGALAGFIGVILGGWMADYFRAKNPAGRLIVALFGVIAPVPFYIVCFTTDNAAIYYFTNFVIGIFGASALGACAATTQDLVLPRMRGVATATFFVATTLIGLGLGPYLAGYIATITGDRATGLLALLGATPISIALFIHAYRNVPQATATVVERARAAGEAI
ncbi:MAG: spinster family MFS transporter [Sphingorhabdus sp.]